MGNKRIGHARLEAVIERLNRKLNLENSELTAQKITLSDAGEIHGDKIVTTDASGTLSITGSIHVSGYINAPAFANYTTIQNDVIILDNCNSLVYGPITVSATNTLIVSGGLKIKDLSDA